MATAQDDSLEVKHLAGLGFEDGEVVRVHREGDGLIFRARATVVKTLEEAIPGTGGFKTMQFKFEEKEKTAKLAIQDIEGIEIVDESGRSVGKAAVGAVVGTIALGPIGLIVGSLIGARKRFKSVIIMQIKPHEKPAYQIVLGGEKQEDVRKKYDSLLKLIQE